MKNAQLELDNDGTQAPLLVSLTGQGLLGPSLSVGPTEAKYGKVPLGSSASQTLTLSNGGDAPLQIQGVILIAGVAGGVPDQQRRLLRGSRSPRAPPAT